jgi:hypothetical protein
MPEMQPWSPEGREEARPFFLIVMALVLMAGLIGVSLILSGGGGSASAGGGGAGYQPLPILPQTPVNTSNPAADPPQVTIIKDTRDFLHRLPLDRNTPKGWTNPKVTKKKP